MANLVPATNVQVATVAGFLSAVIEHICKANGVIIPDDVSAGLPAFVAVVIAYIMDTLQGNNKVTLTDKKDDSNVVQK